MRFCIVLILILMAAGWLQPRPADPTPPPFPFSTDDVDALLRTVVGEVRSQGDLEIAAVVHVIYNRWRSGRFGKTLRHVVWKKGAFSCWNADDPNRVVISQPGVGYLARYTRIRNIALATLRNRVARSMVDPTYGANHYWHPEAMRIKGQAPYWAANFEVCSKIGSGVFCRL